MTPHRGRHAIRSAPLIVRAVRTCVNLVRAALTGLTGLTALDPAPRWPGEGQGGRCEE